ncbi:MAG TPA: hypothetical protein VMV49_18560 [Candidatus Deferrimicrobium sp.]|nr:hypothetical protein [Candidatus Deferrimicrobium sp.]
MKQILISILHSQIMEITKDPLIVNVADHADIVSVLIAADQIFAQVKKGPFPIENLSSLLQLVWNPREWNFYDDVGVEGRSSDGKWLKIRADLSLNLPPNSDIKLTPDAGC